MKITTLLFFLIPLLEMVILIKVGGLLGVLPTVLLVVLTAVIGVILLRREGMATLGKVAEKLQQGEVPGTEMLEGIMLIIGGALLLTPGFATDFIGFVCLMPGLRRPLATRIIASGMFRSINIHFEQHSGQSAPQGKGRVFEGEFEAEPEASQQVQHEPKQGDGSKCRLTDKVDGEG